MLNFYYWKLYKRFKQKNCCVILFGEMRNTIDKLDNISKNLILPNNADVFISSWDYDKYKKCTIDKNYIKKIDWYLSPKSIDLFNFNNEFAKDDINDLRHVYRMITDDNQAISFIAKWFHIENAFNKTQNYKYVCISRIDTIYHNKINIQSDDLCIPADGDAFNGINDNLVYGPRDLVENFVEAGGHMGKTMLGYAFKNQVFHPERLLRYHLINIKNLTIKRTLDKFTIKDSFSYGLPTDIEYMDNKPL